MSDSLYRAGLRPVLDRDDSTKPTTNPKSHDHNASRRFSGNLKAATTKAPIIGLPNKVNTNQQHSGYLGHSARKQQQHRGKILPKKGVKVLDPGSPKVSCFGKVLSGREQRRTRCWTSVLEAVLFLRFCGCRREETAASAAGESGRNIPERRRKHVMEVTVLAEAGPGLGGMRKFTSGRRAASWGDDVEANLDMDVGHGTWSGPLDRP